MATIENGWRVLGVEALCAAKGVDLSGMEGAGPGQGAVAVYPAIREGISQTTEDRIIHIAAGETWGVGETMGGIKESVLLRN